VSQFTSHFYLVLIFSLIFIVIYTDAGDRVACQHELQRTKFVLHLYHRVHFPPNTHMNSSRDGGFLKRDSSLGKDTTMQGRTSIKRDRSRCKQDPLECCASSNNNSARDMPEDILSKRTP
jgi:hypothetical protein